MATAIEQIQAAAANWSIEAQYYPLTHPFGAHLYNPAIKRTPRPTSGLHKGLRPYSPTLTTWLITQAAQRWFTWHLPHNAGVSKNSLYYRNMSSPT